MPIYEFVCDQCQREQELLLRGDQSPHCEQCGSGKLSKLLSVPAAHAASSGNSGPAPEGPCGSSCGCFPQ